MHLATPSRERLLLLFPSLMSTVSTVLIAPRKYILRLPQAKRGDVELEDVMAPRVVARYSREPAEREVLVHIGEVVLTRQVKTSVQSDVFMVAEKCIPGRAADREEEHGSGSRSSGRFPHVDFKRQTISSWWKKADDDVSRPSRRRFVFRIGCSLHDQVYSFTGKD